MKIKTKAKLRNQKGKIKIRQGLVSLKERMN